MQYIEFNLLLMRFVISGIFHWRTGDCWQHGYLFPR